MLPESQFWQIIDTSREQARQRTRAPGQDFMTIHEQTLAETLRQLPPADIAAFNERFWSYRNQAYRWNLWAAAYWLHGGCGDDGFIDFRSSLISLGKELFFQVLNDPDTLSDIVDRPDIPYLQSEGFQYVASKVYEEKTGTEMPLSDRDDDAPQEPAGEQLDHDDKEVMQQHFPKLVAKFPDMGD